MQLKDFARRLPDEMWDLFEPISPPRIGCGNGRKPKTNQDCFHALMDVLVMGIPWERLPVELPFYKTVHRRLKPWLALDRFHQAWQQLAARYQELHGINGDQVLLDGSKKPAKKRDQQTGPSPVDRGKSGTALQLACEGRAMPLGVVVTPAHANDGCHSQKLLAAWEPARNRDARPVNWRFITSDACIKLKRLYPSFQDG
ncbi:MAG TPA: transposase [Candidatus Competibacteraceae bacterium]|nr:transposase [Candidatus Competibacteraceae bacterium]